MCWGLAACSLMLFLAWLGNIRRFCPFVVLDDRFFGFQSDWFWIYYLVDMLVQATILGLLRTRPKAATSVGIPWTSFFLLETLGDLPVFVHDAHMVLEETLFALTYAYLLLLLVTHMAGLAGGHGDLRAQHMACRSRAERAGRGLTNRCSRPGRPLRLLRCLRSPRPARRLNCGVQPGRRDSDGPWGRKEFRPWGPWVRSLLRWRVPTSFLGLRRRVVEGAPARGGLRRAAGGRPAHIVGSSKRGC
jgi:hypothetical protein